MYATRESFKISHFFNTTNLTFCEGFANDQRAFKTQNVQATISYLSDSFKHNNIVLQNNATSTQTSANAIASNFYVMVSYMILG